MAELEELGKNLSAFQDNLKEFENHIGSLTDLKSLENLGEKISLLDSARINAALAYTLNSLYFIYMKINGIPMENHKINQEIERIRSYINKIDAVVNIDEEEKEPKINVNKYALGRIIKATVKINKEILNQEKQIIESEIKEWNNEANEMNKFSLTKESKKIHKGSLMPNTKHLKWKEKIEKMLK